MSQTPHATRANRRVSRSILAVLSLLASSAVGGAAFAQDAIVRANSLYADIVPGRHADAVVLPALIGLEPPPLGVETPEKAAMAFAEARVWPAAEAWATAPTQRAVIEALAKATKAETYEDSMAFAQGYGVDGIDVSLIRGRMYTELGDPPLLSAAQHLYMEKFDHLRCLVHIEAARLAAEGDPVAGMKVLIGLAEFGYQMADREFFTEARWGYHTMADAIRRIRDIAYVDFRGGRTADPDGIREVIGLLDPQKGPMRLDRLNFPRANRIAAEQLIEVLYVPRGGVDTARFVPTMVRLATTDRPLRRFSAASEFQGLMGRQTDWFDIDDVLKDVFTSWEKGWLLDRFDPVLALPFAWETERVNDTTAVVREGVGEDMSELFELRTLVQLERVGTRQALGLLGRFYVQGSFAPRIDGIRPRWVDVLDDDPLNATRAGGRLPPMRYFRPITDAFLADERAEPKPHAMQVFPGDGTNFEVVLRDDQFLVYSTGADGADNKGLRMSQDSASLIGDYLIWPPLLSLHREHLRQIGELE